MLEKIMNHWLFIQSMMWLACVITVIMIVYVTYVIYTIKRKGSRHDTEKR